MSRTALDVFVFDQNQASSAVLLEVTGWWAIQSSINSSIKCSSAPLYGSKFMINMVCFLVQSICFLVKFGTHLCHR